MRTIVQYINKLIFPILPETRCFGLKRTLLRWSGAKIGRNVRVCSSVMIAGAGNLTIGDNTWVGHRTMLIASSCIKIGSNVDIGPNVFIGNGTHRLTPDRERIAGIELSEDVTIGNGCWLCANSMILPGVVVGNQCVVAAGAVVTKSFAKRCMLAGIPAEVKKQI